MKKRSALRTVAVAGANPVPPGMLHSDRKTRRITVPRGATITAAPRRNPAGRPGKPIAVSKSKPGARSLQRDLTRYYESCLDTAPSKVQGQRRKSYCAGVAWKRARNAGRHAPYFRSNPQEKPMATKAKENPWTRRKHPRGPRGQFVSKSGGSRRKRARRNPVAAAAPAPRAVRRAPVRRAAPAPTAVRSNPMSHTARSRAAKKGWSRRRGSVSAAPRRRSRRNPWSGESGRHVTAAKKGWETRRGKTHKAKYKRRHSTSGYTIGRNETLIIRSNPMGMLGTVLGAVVMGGIGYTIADVVDRYIATRPIKGIGADTVHLTGAAAATAIQHLSWGRVAIEAALAVAGVAGGMYLKKGMLRTATIAFGLGASVKVGVDVIGKALVPALFGGARAADGTLDLTADTMGNRLFADLLQQSSESDGAATAAGSNWGSLRGNGNPQAVASGQTAGCGKGCQCDGTSTCGCNDCGARRMATTVWNQLQQQRLAVPYPNPPVVLVGPASNPAVSGLASNPAVSGLASNPAVSGLAGAPDSDFGKVLNMGMHSVHRTAAR